MNVVFREITKKARFRYRAVMMSSTMPSTKFLLRVATHVLERQDRDRGLFGQRQRRCRREIQRHWRIFYGGPDIEHADRASNVFDLLLAAVFLR